VTSGNTGVALAMVGTAKGYRVTILMSEGASHERRHLIKQLGAELILFKSAGRYQSGMTISREMAAKDPRYFLPRQFENPLNALDHEQHTGPEIIRQVPGPIDAFVSGYGTGERSRVREGDQGSLPRCADHRDGAGRGAILAGECPCCHFIEGWRMGRPAAPHGCPGRWRTEGAERRCHGHDAPPSPRVRPARRDELGANVAAALAVARELGPTATVVTILCDRAEPVLQHAALCRTRQARRLVGDRWQPRSSPSQSRAPPPRRPPIRLRPRPRPRARSRSSARSPTPSGRASHWSPFYQKHLDLDGFPILGSKNVSDHAMREAAWIVRNMLAAGRGDILRTMAGTKVRLVVMAASEYTTDVPEHAGMEPKVFWIGARAAWARRRRTPS